MGELSDLVFFTSVYVPIIISGILVLPVSILAYFSYKLQKQSHNRIVEREESNYLWEIDDIFGQLKFAFTAVNQVLDGHIMSQNNFSERLLIQNNRCFTSIENGTSRLTNSELRRFAYRFSHASVICKNFEEKKIFDLESIEKFIQDCRLLVHDYGKKLDQIDNEYDFY